MMSSDDIDTLNFFYDLFSIEIVERRMECLDVSSVVSGQLLNAGIKHRAVYGAAHIDVLTPAIVLAPHYYIEVLCGRSTILIDPSLAFWLEDEIADGLSIPFVFEGYEEAKERGVSYSFFEEIVLCGIVCSDLLDLIDRPPSLHCLSDNSAAFLHRYTPAIVNGGSMHICHLLSYHSKCALDYALHLYKHQNGISSADLAQPSVLDIALWVIEAH